MNPEKNYLSADVTIKFVNETYRKLQFGLQKKCYNKAINQRFQGSLNLKINCPYGKKFSNILQFDYIFWEYKIQKLFPVNLYSFKSFFKYFIF